MRRAALSGALLVLLTFGAAAAPAQEGTIIAPAGTPTFPERAYRLSIPTQRELQPADVRVTENGDPVSKFQLASAGGAAVGEFGSILVIDTSASMKGSAIRNAIGAARVLARQRSGSQQLGIVLFNKTARVLLQPTDDATAIEQALRTIPKLAPQTHIYDGVHTALDLLEAADITAGSVVVLSDGSDTGSAISKTMAAARARKANVAIYAVGLRSGAFDASGLKTLADAGRGSYIAADSVFDLRGVFRDIGTRLASDYLVRYRSFVDPGRDVTVAVRVAGVDGVATSSYTVPGGATFVQIEKSFWTSTLGVVVVGLVCALLLALGLGILLVSRGRAPSLRERVRSFISQPGDVVHVEDAELGAPVSRGAEKSLERMRWWAEFKEQVEIARIQADPVRIVIGTAFATLVGAYLLLRMTGLPLVGIFALAIPWGVRTWVRILRDRQRQQFVEQLPDVLQSCASAIRAGHGLVAALAMVAEDAAEPSRSELLRVVADESLGVPLDEALRVVQYRMDSREVLQIALVAQIQREAGGNMAEVLDRVTEALRQRAELRRMVSALTAQGRLSRWVVTALPIVLLLFISVANPTYVAPLFTEPLGLMMLGSACVMMFLGSLVIGKIVNFKV